MSSQTTVTVSILGKDYQINCPPEEVDSLKKSASYLDEKMKDIKSNSNLIGLDRLAVMAALNISHEFLSSSAAAASSATQSETELQALNDKMDKALLKLKKA